MLDRLQVEFKGCSRNGKQPIGSAWTRLTEGLTCLSCIGVLQCVFTSFRQGIRLLFFVFVCICACVNSFFPTNLTCRWSWCSWTLRRVEFIWPTTHLPSTGVLTLTRSWLSIVQTQSSFLNNNSCLNKVQSDLAFNKCEYPFKSRLFSISLPWILAVACFLAERKKESRDCCQMSPSAARLSSGQIISA